MGTGTARPRLLRGAHAGTAFDGWIEDCMAAVGPSMVHHLAQYSHGTLDFGIDVLEQVNHHVTAPGWSVDSRREETSHLGRQLHFIMRNINESLSECDSGRVLRAVFHVASGALFFLQIRPGQYLVGLSVVAETVPAADQAMATAATSIRARLGLPDQSPGGFHLAPGEPGGLRPADPASVTTGKNALAGPADDVFLELASAGVTQRGMDFAARFENASWTSFADAFEDSSLAVHFTAVSKRRRRNIYQEIGAQYRNLSSAVDRALYGVVRERIARAVIDVEQGALFFQRRGDDELLMGVTLAQARVRSAEESFVELVERFWAATRR